MISYNYFTNQIFALIRHNMSYIKQFIHDHDIHDDKQLKNYLTRLNKSKLDNKNLDILVNLLLINYLKSKH